MAGLDDLMSQIPVSDIAGKLGAPEGEVNQAIQTLVPTLVGSIQHNVVSDDIDSSELESAIAAGDPGHGEQGVARIFGGHDTDQVASATCWAASSVGAREAPAAGTNPLGDILGGLLGGKK
ncbi:hypothetical protein MycrhDRAFT_4348 [Mycolicibacterium rhodesiae JS60]|nr:hypothetical protein MycrhDRAFT_4348 [Mycolicibacterium rhodesiae JS60]